MTSLVELARQSVRYRVMRRISNPTHDWHGIEDPMLPTLSVARVGDCSWQEIDHAHTLGGPGYPAVMAERLRDRGIAMKFTTYFAGAAADVTPAGLERFVPRDCDLILIQFGTHARLEILPLERWGFSSLRLWVNSRAGGGGGWWHRRLTSPLVRRFGRPTAEPERIEGPMQALLEWLQANREAPILVLSPHPVLYRGLFDREAVADAARRYLAAADRAGVMALDYRPALLAAAAGREREFTAATGYDLRRPGHEVVADQILQAVGWLTSLPVSVEA